jgi:hypothetical protein
MLDKGEIAIAGCMYDLETGKVEFTKMTYIAFPQGSERIGAPDN